MDWTPIIVVLAACTTAAITDVWKFKVYNLLTFPLIISGLLYWSVQGGVDLGWRGALNGAGESLLGIGFGMAILWLPYAMGGMGAGDVKLMMGIGAWLKFYNAMLVFIAGALIGGAFSIGLMLTHQSSAEVAIRLRFLLHTWKQTPEPLEDQLAKSDRRKNLVPFGGMLFMGTLCVVGYLYFAR